MAVEMMSAFSTSETVALEKRVDIEDVAQLVDLGFDERYDLDKCVRWIKENDLTKICLQFPDGLLKDSAEVALCLERRTGQCIYILADTSYGSCCVDEVAAQHVDADAIIHFGHSCLSATRRLPVLYVFDKYSLDMVHFLSSFRSQFLCRESRILLMYDVGYSHVIDEVATKLALEYHNLVVSKLALSSDTEEGEQKMLGRRFSLQEGTKLEDYTVLFIGRDGHTLSNIVLASAETLAYIYDPTEREGIVLYEGTRSKFLRRRLYLIEKVKDANTLGVLIGTLGVVDYLSAVERIKLLAKSQGKKCYIISVGKPNVAKLANFSEIDVFVLVACPENSLMDAKDFYHPIVTLYDVEIACNPQRIFQLNYVLEFQNLLPGGSRYVELSEEEEQQEQSLDVSLITGKVRGRLESSAAPSTTVATKGDLELATLGTTGSNYLASRTWHGLEVRLGQDDVMPAEKGLCGLPRGYQSEPDPKPQS